MKTYKILSSFVLILFLSGCCPDGFIFPVDDTICEDQVFKESKVVPISFTYKVNTTQEFSELRTLTASDIQKLLNVEGSNFKLKNMELTGATFQYLRHPDNTAVNVFVNIVVADFTNELFALLAKDQLVPLYDIPSIGGFTPEVNINQFLNEKGVKELSKVIKRYFDVLNDQGVGFLLKGEPSPKGLLAHFDILVKMTVSIEYEVCRFVPMGTGLRVCEQ